MRLPYLSRSIEVIELNEHYCKRLILNKSFGTIKLTTSEKLDKNSFENSELFGKSDLTAILLPPDAFEYMPVDFPDIDDADELNEWVFEYFSHHITDDPNNYLIKHIHLNADSNEHKILIIYLNKNKFAEYKDKIDQSKLQPVYIGCGIESAGFALSLSENLFEKKNIFIYLGSQRTLIFEYEKGLLTGFHEFDSSNLDVDNLVQKNETTLIWYLNKKCDLDEPEYPIIDNKKILPSCFFQAGIGMNILFDLTEQLNLLPDKERELILGKAEKKNSLTISTFFAAIFLFLFVFINIGIGISRNINSRLDSELSLIQDKLSQITQQQDEIEILKKHLNQTSEITLARSHFSGYLELVGRNIPRGVSLEKLAIIETDNGISILVSGSAGVKTKVADLLSNFEQEKFFNQVELKYIESTRDLKKPMKQIFEIEIGI